MKSKPQIDTIKMGLTTSWFFFFFLFAFPKGEGGQWTVAIVCKQRERIKKS